MNHLGLRPQLDPDQMSRRLSALVQKGKAASVAARADELGRTYRNHAGVQHVISEAAALAGDFPTAVRFAEAALQLDAQNVKRLLHLAMCLIGANQQRRAGSILRRAERFADLSADVSSMLASLFVRIGEYERAAKLYKLSIRQDPGSAKHRFSLAATCRFIGEFDEAEQACNEALALDPAEYEAYLIRADLRSQSPARNHIHQLESALARKPRDYMGEVMLCYALAKEHEDLRLYEKSFEYLSRGARLRRRHLSYDVERDVALIDRIIGEFSQERVRHVAPAGSDTSEPIFIVGMPRTGTTLVERILGSHSEVSPAGELPNFPQAMTQLLKDRNAGRTTEQSAMVAASLELDMRQLGESYLQSTRGVTGDSKHFIDKLPFNYLNIGLIRLALPNARIVHVVRDPMDTCYAVYKTLFKRAYPFSYSLEDIGKYFLAYRRLMRHWKSLFPGSMHEVEYEGLVDEPTAASRRLVEYCGLSWEDQLSRFHESDAPSTTASATQVRQPVYRSSVGKWRNYVKQLQPLLGILRAGGVEIRA